MGQTYRMTSNGKIRHDDFNENYDEPADGYEAAILVVLIVVAVVVAAAVAACICCALSARETRGRVHSTFQPHHVIVVQQHRPQLQPPPPQPLPMVMVQRTDANGVPLPAVYAAPTVGAVPVPLPTAPPAQAPVVAY